MWGDNADEAVGVDLLQHSVLFNMQQQTFRNHWRVGGGVDWFLKVTNHNKSPQATNQ